ncbi:MAG: hypothetical protein IJR54_09325 [Oscillibacter sp.]|nr:hypothetical protein [Oscillibacter sp.]
MDETLEKWEERIDGQADMTEEERAELVTEIRCALFDDLSIRLEDIFYYVD